MATVSSIKSCLALKEQCSSLEQATYFLPSAFAFEYNLFLNLPTRFVLKAVTLAPLADWLDNRLSFALFGTSDAPARQTRTSKNG